MTVGPESRRGFPPRRTKWLLGALLVLAPVLAPIEAPDLPAPLDTFAGAAHAYAQTPPPTDWTTGTPADCPDTPRPWTEEEGNCVLMTHACPKSPLTDPADPIELMRLSVPPTDLADEINPPGTPLADVLEVAYPGPVPAGMMRYPEFCELRIESDHAKYGDCLTTTGFAVMQYADQNGDTIEECRLLYPVKCPVVDVNGTDVGLHRLEARTCKAVQRRTWQCDAGYIPGNRFNECYRALQSSVIGTHPACGVGAPYIPLISCADYVGTDYPYQSGDLDCVTDYHTGYSNPAKQLQPNSRTGASSNYWCEFDAALLRVECHETPTPSTCTADTMSCIKRLTAIGGCSLIANTIHCRSLQEELSRGVVAVRDLLRVDCVPCVVLPFSPPTGCPEEISEEPEPSQWVSNPLFARWYEAIFRIRDDFAVGHGNCSAVILHERRPNSRCRRVPTCADPPIGVLSWESAHFSGLALVNRPVVFEISRPSYSHIQMKIPQYDSTAPDQPISWPNDWTSIPRYQYTSGPPRSSNVRTWVPVNDSRHFNSLRTMLDGECTVRYEPSFRISVRELWPGNTADQDEILRLFGAESLNWWMGLSSEEQQRRTDARGSALLEIIECNHFHRAEPNNRIWCRWEPKRSGYYVIVGEVAWVVEYSERREWSAPQIDAINNYLQTQSNRTDVVNKLRNLNRQRRRLGQNDLSLADLGLEVDSISGEPVNTLPLPANRDEQLFTATSDLTGCPPIDLRIACAGEHSSGNHTETEPIGIMVHEVRVGTVTPSR